MLVIEARNVNDAYHEALWKMKILGIEADSRNGKVRRIPDPVATTYTHPWERMLYHPQRDANPFFHVFEAIWMLAGREDAEFLEQFNSNIGNYADNGILLGAYGYRWRGHFGHDQLLWAVRHLRGDRTSRRCVLQMYDPAVDQYEPYEAVPKDIPCNTTIYFSTDQQTGKLNMTVCCRSNDMIWGCYGSNVVHFSYLLEFVATATGLEMGKYTQFSNDFHIYERHFPLIENIKESDIYPTPKKGQAFLSLTHTKYAEKDLVLFDEWCEEPLAETDQPYICGVLQPMYQAYQAYKEKDKTEAFNHCSRILDEYVALACREWLGRRKWEVT